MKILAKLRREVLVGLSKVGLKKATVFRENRKFKIPLFHGMGRFLFVTYEPWRKKTLKAIAQMNPQVVMDVGVNVGQTMLDIFEEMPDVTYYGFEPNPACVFYTNQLGRLNELTNASILPFGLGEKSEMNKLYSSGWDDASSSIHERKGTYSSVIYTKRGDEFIKEERIENISFIKIDTEGYEFKVLKGLHETIKRDQPIIFCEIFQGKEENLAIHQFFEGLDYITYEQGEEYQLRKMDLVNIFQNPCHDYIFAPRNKSEDFEKRFNND